MWKIGIVDGLRHPLPLDTTEEVCGQADSRECIHTAHRRDRIAPLHFVYRPAVPVAKFLGDSVHFSMEQWIGRRVNLRRDSMIVEAPQGCQQNANVDPRLLRFAHVGHLHAGPVGSARQLAFGANRQIFANDVSDLDDVAQHLPLIPLYRCIAERPVEKRQHFPHVHRHGGRRERFHQLAGKQRERNVRKAVIADDLVLMTEIWSGYELQHRTSPEKSLP